MASVQPQPDQLDRFRTFLRNELLADLEAWLSRRNQLDRDIEQLQALHQTVATLESECSQHGFINVLGDLGCEFFVQARVAVGTKQSDFKRCLCVNIGMDVHLEMSLDEAAEFASARLASVEAEREAACSKIGQIQAYAALFAYGLSALPCND
ncbi:hypothetical protein BOX15_Mlig016111g1 [Macrostomum lignano]|uniref:Uncharacterized protein n=1 Tax=Macrostomum lignano TaxID=282301 RepID=A0A267DTU0_9PLAT|nr:hypothetical protein BOX15_Mlig016111g1 [Macrostomum lignano]